MSAAGSMSINLLPAARQKASRTRARARAWIIGGTLYGAALGLASAMVAVRSSGAAEVSAKLADSAARGAELDEQLKAVRGTMATTRREAEAVREIQEHPDWSALVGCLARAAGPTLILDHCSLRPTPAKDGGGKGEKLANVPSGFTLSLTGLAVSNADVAEFTENLERLKLFESVSIVSIRAREGARVPREGESGTLVSFDIVCALSDAGAASADASGGER